MCHNSLVIVPSGEPLSLPISHLLLRHWLFFVRLFARRGFYSFFSDSRGWRASRILDFHLHTLPLDFVILRMKAALYAFRYGNSQS